MPSAGRMYRCCSEQGKKLDSKEAVLKIKDASYPAPFASELEYNSPVHGNWNIVHSGMQVPESIQIYVCADNCMRGVVLTAAEMNAADRFSFVILEEQDLLNSNLEDITVEGVTDVLNKRGDHPKRCCCLRYVCIILWEAIWIIFTVNWSIVSRISALFDVIWIQSCKSMG